MTDLNTLENTVKEARNMRRKAVASATHYKKQVIRYTQNKWSNVHIEQFKSDLRIKADLITQLTAIIDKGVNRIKLMKEIAKLKAEVATRQAKLVNASVAKTTLQAVVNITKPIKTDSDSTSGAVDWLLNQVNKTPLKAKAVRIVKKSTPIQVNPLTYI